MGAFFSVGSKVPITAIVIVFEMTTDFNLLPLMIGSVTAYLLPKHSVAHGQIFELSIHLQKNLCKDFGRVDSKDVMQPRSKPRVQMTLDGSTSVFPPIIAATQTGWVTQTDLTKMRDRQLTGILT